MTRHPRRLVKRNRAALLVIAVCATVALLWSGAFPACTQHARDQWTEHHR